MVDEQIIFDTVDDLIEGFLNSDRKDDEDLPKGEIEKAIKEKRITIDSIVIRFRKQLIEGIQ